jgi:hypothetical protein
MFEQTIYTIYTKKTISDEHSITRMFVASLSSSVAVFRSYSRAHQENGRLIFEVFIFGNHVFGDYVFVSEVFRDLCL